MTTNSETRWLAVDVGNSQIKVGLFETSGETAAASAKLPTTTTGLPRCVSVSTVPLAESVDWDKVFENRSRHLRSVVAGSNQHGVDRVVGEWPKWLTRPVVMRNSESLRLGIQVDEPRRVGLDRLLNAVAANAVRGSGQAAIIVDCGTATTIDLVSSSGSFCGGAILPGFTLCARALNQYTEVLPLISLDELFALPPSEDCHPALGSNTQAAIMSGVFWGQIGAVRELLARLSGTLPKVGTAATKISSPHQVLLTGGGARLLVPYFENAIHCPHLPLQGLVLAAASDSRF